MSGPNLSARGRRHRKANTFVRRVPLDNRGMMPITCSFHVHKRAAGIAPGLSRVGPWRKRLENCWPIPRDPLR